MNYTYCRLLTILALSLFSTFASSIHASEPKTRNVILVTMDGLRIQELFSGADLRLMNAEDGGVENPTVLKQKYWHDDTDMRRKRLMPFVWEVIANEGQLFGAVEKQSVVMVKNKMLFSYPGYNEILCGFPDEQVTSNAKKNNENVTVLEWLHQKSDFHGKVAAFASWDVFPYIINSQRSGIYVNAGWEELTEVADPSRKQLLNQALRDTPHYWGSARFDFFTAMGALEYLRLHKLRILYIAFDETDDWCHSGRYDLYLDAAHRCDQYLRQLWEFVQNTPEYKDRTSLVLTTDHGRGNGREGWKNHSTSLPGSEFAWIAVLGPDTPALQVRSNVAATQGQVAATVAALLGHDFASTDERIASPLPMSE